jgi:Lar family restriction alleviation protein
MGYIERNELVKKKYGELKPCPFCGDKDVNFYRDADSHYLYCGFCRARTANFSVVVSEDMVAKYWNKRAV